MYLRNGVTRKIWRAALFAACGVAVMVLSLAPAVSGDEKDIHVGYRFTPDASQDFKVEFSQEYEVKGYSFYTLVDLEYTETCVEVTDDTLYTMEITLNEVSAQMKRNDDLMDSGLDEDMTGQVFRFDINRNGIISKIQAKGYMESEDEVMSIVQVVLSGSYPYLPDEVTGEGGEWTFEGSTIQDKKTDMEIESDSVFKIEKFKKEKDRECAMVKRTGESYISGRIENQNGAFVLDGQGEGEAEFYFDIVNGCVIKLKSESTAEITSIDASGGSAGEREAFTSNISYNLKKELK